MRDNILERIKKLHLTKCQRKIADFFVKNYGRLGSLSSLEIANETGTSDASVIRFSRLLGFKGYSDLKDHVYSTLAANYGDTPFSVRQQSSNDKFKGASPDALDAQFLNTAKENIDFVFNTNNVEEIQKAVDLLKSTRYKYVIGLRGRKYVARSFGRVLSFMLPNVIIIDDDDAESLAKLQNSSKDDVVLIFSFMRFYKADLVYIHKAKEHGAKICLITNSLSGPLNKYADIVLCVGSTGMSFFHSDIALTFLDEYILTLISEQCNFTEKLNEIDEFIRPQIIKDKLSNQ